MTTTQILNNTITIAMPLISCMALFARRNQIRHRQARQKEQAQHSFPPSVMHGDFSFEVAEEFNEFLDDELDLESDH